MSIERMYQVLGRTLWRAMLVLVVCLAVYVAGARALLSALPMYQQNVADWLAQQTGLNYQIANIQGDVEKFQPSIQVTGLHIVLPSGLPIAFESAALTVDPWASLLARQIRLDTLRLNGLALDLPVDALSINGGNGSAARLAAGLLVAFRKVTIEQTEIWLVGAEGSRERLDLTLDLHRAGSKRQLAVELTGPDSSYLSISGSSVGDILQLDRFAGELYGHLNLPNAKWLSTLLGYSFNANGNFDFWYQSNSLEPNIEVSLDLSDLIWTHQDGRISKLDNLAFDGGGNLQPAGWTGRLQSFAMSAADTGFTLDRFQIESRGDSLQFKTQAMDVGDLAAAVVASGLLPSKVSTIFSELRPSGSVLALEAELANWRQPLSDWSIMAQVHDISVQARKKAPGLLGLDGTVLASQRGAKAWIDTRNFTLDLPTVYRKPIEFTQVLGQLSASWDANTLYLHQGIFEGEHEEHHASALFGMAIPLVPNAAQGPPLAMYLDVGVPDASVDVRQNYIPYRIPDVLEEWLESSILGGGLSETSFSWRGGFKGFGSGLQSLQIGTVISDGSIKFQTDWPRIDDFEGALLVDTDRVSVWGRQGSISDAIVEGVSVEVDAARTAGELLASGQFRGEGTAALNLLRHSPIYNATSALLDDLELEGFVTGDLELAMDIRPPAAPPQVAVSTELSKAKVRSHLLALTLEDVEGGLDFNSETGFSGRNLQSTLFGQPVVAAIGVGRSGLDDADILDAKFVAEVSGSDLLLWSQNLAAYSLVGEDPPQLLSGKAQVTVDVAVGTGAQFNISSTLEGMTVALPEPLAKSAGEAAPLNIVLRPSAPVPLQAFWFERGQAQLFQDEAGIPGLALDLTPRPYPVLLPDNAIPAGIDIFGQMAHVELDPWLAVLRQVTFTNDRASPQWPLRINTLKIDEVVVGTIAVEDVTLDVTPYATWHQLGINTAWLDAELTIPNDDQNIALIINQLDYDQLSGLSTVATDLYPLENEVRARRPPELPVALDVTVANLTFKEQALGAAKFRLSSAADALVIEDIQGQLAGMKLLEGSGLTWSESDQGRWITDLSVRAEVFDLQRTFTDLSLEPLVTTRSGIIQTDLAWPGGPTDLDLLALSGSAQVELKEGSFLPVSSGATGAVRLFSLLNLAGLFGRADVTRIFDPGVAFRSAAGQFEFSPGNVQIPEFNIVGTGGGFNFSSDIDLVTEMIDGELVVTLPLVENIPWVAALVGGIPVAAGAYLVSKVFEDQFLSLSSGVYAVKGNLSAPEVKFIRIFDAGSDVDLEGQTSEPPE